MGFGRLNDGMLLTFLRIFRCGFDVGFDCCRITLLLVFFVALNGRYRVAGSVRGSSGPARSILIEVVVI